MIKGWKNDPAWVAYYDAKKEKVFQKRIAKRQAEHLMSMTMQDADRAIRDCERTFARRGIKCA